MKIFGDKSSTEFKTYAKEPGLVFGHNDVLKASKTTVRYFTASFFGSSHGLKTIEPKLYLHIPKNPWTTFTGKLREIFLPWRWKTAYLDQENGTKLRRILVCTSAHDSELPAHLSKLLGRSLFVTQLINSNQYDEVFGQEFIRLKSNNNRREIKIAHPLGEFVGVQFNLSSDLFCHIYRQRSLYSSFKYHLLKHCSSSWKEVAIQAGQASEKILIKKSDEAAFSRSGLIAK